MAGAVHAQKQRPDVLREIVPPVARSATLTVGHAFDPAEAEADRVADTVIARLRADSADSHEHAGTCEHDVQRSSAPAAAAEVGREGGALSAGLTADIESQRGRGSALPAGVRRRMESAFGHELGDVSIHTGDKAARLSSAVSAKAFTTGNDIFFGAGQFRPDTAAGEHMLAHELAHTQQQGGLRRVHRLWDFNAKDIPWGNAVELATVPSGQAVFFAKDGTGDKLVIKTEDKEVGIGELSSVMHMNLANVKSVHHRKLNSGDRTAFDSLLATSNKLDQTTFAKVGAKNREVSWVKKDLAGRIDGMSDAEVGQYFQQQQILSLRGAPLVAMTYGGDQTASKAGKATDTNQMKPEKNRLRGLFTNPKHLENLGQLTAVDLFMGNKDRVYGGNLGNWIYDPYSAAITTIDHVDAGTSSGFGKNAQTNEKLDNLLAPLAAGALRNTAKETVEGIVMGMKNPDFAGDLDFATWLDAEGGYRRKAMEEFIEHGLVAGRKLLIKTFSATRFTIGGSKARSTKKAIKAAAKEAVATDRDEDDTSKNDPDRYYKILKARVAWLKKNS